MTLPPAPAPSRASLRTLALVFLGALVVHGCLQAFLFRADTPLSDSWFHARYAWLLGTGGTPWHGLEFPYMAHSAYADRPVDWALGWHWLVAPLTFLTNEPIDGIRVACAVLDAGLVTVFYAVLAAGGNRQPLLWTILLHVVAPYWLYRIHLARPTPTAVAGLLVLWHFATQRRAFATGVTACVTMLLYQVPTWPVVLLGVTGVCLWIADRPFPWRLAGAAAAGLALGVVLHPGFWDVRGGPFSLDRGTFQLWVNMGHSSNFARYGGRWHFGDGSMLPAPLPLEMLAPTADAYVNDYLPLLAAMAAALAGALLRPWTVRAASAAALAIAALVLTSQSNRFSEYWVPFTILAAAEALDGAQRAPSRVRHGILLAAAAVCALVAIRPIQFSNREMKLADVARELRPALAAIGKRAKPGDIVFHGSWDEFANLFYEAPGMRFIQGFDPWFLIAHDPEDHRAMGTVIGSSSTDAEFHSALVHRFGARYVLFWRRKYPDGWRSSDYDLVIRRLGQTQWAHVIHQDDATVAFELD